MPRLCSRSQLPEGGVPNVPLDIPKDRLIQAIALVYTTAFRIGLLREVKPGDKIQFTAEDFERLEAAFFVETKFLKT